MKYLLLGTILALQLHAIPAAAREKEQPLTDAEFNREWNQKHPMPCRPQNDEESVPQPISFGISIKLEPLMEPHTCQ